MANLFLRHLKKLDPVQLEIVLRNRPDAMARPWPRTVQELADRLMKPESIKVAVDQLSLPQIEVLAAIRLLRQLARPATAETIRTLLAATLDEFTAVLRELDARALTWTTADGHVETLAHISTTSTPNGWPVDFFLVSEPVQVLRQLCAAHGIDSLGAKGELIERLTAKFRDEDYLRSLINARADADVLRRIDHREDIEFGDLFARSISPDLAWFAAHALVWPTEDGGATLPLEVQVALREPRWRLPFHPSAPAASVTAVSAEHVDLEARAATLRLIERVTTLLDEITTDPITLTKTVTLPVRTLRSYVKRWDSSDADVAFVFTALLFLDVATPHNEPPPIRPKRGYVHPPPTLRPTDRAAQWQSATIAERARTLAEAWWRATPPMTVHAKPEHAPRESDRALRHAIVGLHAELPAGTARHDCPLQVAWRMPVLSAPQDLVERLMHEAELVGALALGSASELGRGLVAGDLDDAVNTVETTAAANATFGTDLTAVVFGPPELATAQLLDSLAVRESQGAATTWRFSPDSMRLAFDDGASAATVLADLRRISTNGIPQALEYLVNDVERNHGRLLVAAVTCVVVSDDHALLKEISVNRKLAKLGLRLLAPTVVASNAGPAATLEGLRAAGYSPVSEDGKVQVAQTKALPSRTGAKRTTPDIPEPDVTWHAKYLHDGSGPTNSVHLLYRALAHRAPYEVLTRLTYGGVVALEHNSTRHVIHSARVAGNTFSAWSITTGRYEEFPVNEVKLTGHP